MAHVFVSYSNRDKDAVDRLLHLLGGAGFDVWIDREGIAGGAIWRKQIVEAIQGAAIVMLVVSSASVVSDHVRKELDIAEEARKPILPVHIAQIVVPSTIAYQLAGLQRIDLVTNYDAGSTQLLHALKRLMSGAAVAPSGERVEPRARVAEESPTAKTGFEAVWYRDGRFRIVAWQLAFAAIGGLAIAKDRLIFVQERDGLEIAFDQIQSIDRGRLPGDLINRWCIVRYGAPEKIAGFKDGAFFGWAGDTELLCSELRMAVDRWRSSRR